MTYQIKYRLRVEINMCQRKQLRKSNNDTTISIILANASMAVNSFKTVRNDTFKNNGNINK